MPFASVPLIDRIRAKIVVDPSTGCWNWQGATNEKGYGTIREGVRDGGSSKNLRTLMTHRVMYQHEVGPIPSRLVIDHLCRNRACANPAHLEPVTVEENIRRGDAGKPQRERTHCPHGHPYDERNTYHYNGSRHCRACSVSRSRSRTRQDGGVAA